MRPYKKLVKRVGVKRLIGFLACLALFIPLLSRAQETVIDHSQYPFVRFAQNKIESQNPNLLNPLFNKLERLLTYGDNQIQIVHIGDSHIQADFFSGRVRSRLQQFFPGGNGGRGFVFPYTMAHTNNPFNYRVTYTGNWTGCRNVQAKECLLGLAGISVSTTDTLSTFSISSVSASGTAYEYTKVRIFFHANPGDYEVSTTNPSFKTKEIVNTGSDCIEWALNDPAISIGFTIKRLRDSAAAFELMGVSLDTDDPGIIYNAIGVNGAQVTSFLKCDLLEEQLRQLKPDVIILSLGTNDAYGHDFDAATFETNYQMLIDRIKGKNPDAIIILTTPGDCYLYKKYPNKNNLAAKESIFKIAKKNDLAVWDFYDIMGGLGSIQTWYNHGLSTSGKIHLTQKGYELQGDLLFEAIAAAYDQYVTKQGR
jgi:lysophospholipase L1-like esterase